MNKKSSFMLPDLKMHYKAIIIRTVWHWHKNRHTDQRSRVQSSEITLCVW